MSEPVSRPLESVVWAALADVPDPEIPTISVVDLGVVHRVEAERGRIRVELLPTFVGCPAVEAMRRGVEQRLAGMAEQVEVVTTFRVPWTSERITAEGRARLRASGFAPPARAAAADGSGPWLPVLAAAVCPHCGSRRTTLESAFGPTLCRSIHHCGDCRQPFEQFKTV